MGPRACCAAAAISTILLAQTLDGVIGDKEERGARCGAEEHGPKARVDATEIAGGEEAVLGLQAGLDCVQRKKSRVNSDASYCSGLFFIFIFFIFACLEFREVSVLVWGNFFFFFFYFLFSFFYYILGEGRGGGGNMKRKGGGGGVYEK